ncbi:putative ABC multidrug transporter [Xylariales sp. AK1849]|nr:putative ABC multidrug transporter [Xylariales sp. AK1849]
MAINATEDASFGPNYAGSFDFTILFEQSIFSLGPSALLLLAAPFRIAALIRSKSKIRLGILLWLKLLGVLVLFVLQLVNLVLWSLSSAPYAPVATAAASLSLAGAVAIGLLLYAEHRHSYSPSMLVSIFLSITILLDTATIRSLFLRGNLVALGGITSAAVAMKLLLLVLEEFPKKRSAQNTSKEALSGLWNRSVFWWLNVTFRKGFKAFLQVEDLSKLDQNLASDYIGKKLDQTWSSVDKKETHCLALATFKAFQATFWVAVLPRLCYTGFMFAQPFLLQTVVDKVGAPEVNRSQSVIGGLVGATALVYLGIAVTKCHYTHHTYRLITSVRGGLISLIFSKALNLDAITAKDSAAVTLMSTDIDGIASGLQSIHDIWASIIELGLAVYLLERQVGAACFLILVPAVLSSLAIGRVAGEMGPARMAWNAKVQKRVSTISTVLNQIKGIKMMGLSDRVSQLIQSLRVSELNSSKSFRILLVWTNMIANASDQLTPIVVIAAAVFWTKSGRDLGVTEVFTSLSIIALVSTPLVNLISAYPTFVSGLACFGRIQTFLLHDDIHDYRSIASSSRPNTKGSPTTGEIELQSYAKKKTPGTDYSSTVFRLVDASFSHQNSTEPVLKHISIDIRRSTLVMVAGPVGSGKSSLLKALLGEIQILEGSVERNNSRVAYCDQNAWLRMGSIRDNILGPNEFDESWYWQVIQSCALSEDINRFKNGAQTSVGNGGTALSGGQKQRVALARAVYARSPVVLLDDAFSALDNNMAQHIFTRLLGNDGLLRKANTTTVLVTHTTNMLTAADHVIVLGEGGIVASQATHNQLDLSKPLFRALEQEQEAQRYDSSSAKSEDHPLQGFKEKDSVSENKEYELTRKTGDISLYKFYLNSIGAWLFIGWLFLGAGYIFSGKIPQIWLRIWTENGTSNHAASYFGGYLGFGLLCTLFSGLCIYYFMIIVVPKSAQNLHWLLLEAVMRAPLWFFTSMDTSTLLNRFSQDMTLIDQTLPVATFTTTFDVFNVIAGTALIASGATYVAAVIPLCIVAIYSIQKFYLRTSRQMRHLDLEAKSPLYRIFTETATGIATIRAFGWKKEMATECLQLLDHSSRPYYMMYCIQRWLNVVLDLFVAAIAIILVGSALGLSNTATQGSIGLAMLNLMEFNQSLSMLINSWTGLETSLGAIARLKNFLAETKSEISDDDGDEPPPDWLQRGSIKFEKVTAKYNLTDAQSSPAISNVELDLHPGQTVLVIGRTGSGKSSLMLTLLRLLDIESGRIEIDGKDISHIPRQVLRSHILTIPQEPVELPGSVRYNLADVLSSVTGQLPSEDDEAMKRVLTRVKLWDAVASRGGLDVDLDTIGLSGGQKQLFSLARIILIAQHRNSKGGLVLLDEPTSSIDNETSAILRQTVEEEFTGYTIVTISHRLDGIEEADIVVKMANGKVEELTRMA